MQVKIKPTKEFLQCLAENLEIIEEATDVYITIESEKFLRKEDEEYKIEPNMGLIMRLNALAPFVIVLYDTETEEGVIKVKNARFQLNLDYETVRAKCPFCGHEQEYVANFIPYAYPRYCKCGAAVSSDFGDASDVSESLLMYAELVEPDPELKLPAHNLLQAKDKNDKDVIALQIDVDEEGGGTWIIFHEVDKNANNRMQPLQKRV